MNHRDNAIENASNILASQIPENPESIVSSLDISPLTFHHHYIQIRGIHVPDRISRIIVGSQVMFKEFHFRLSMSLAGHVEKIPMKIPLMEAGDTPYHLKGNILSFYGKPLLDIEAEEIPLPEKDTPRHLKGYSLPFLGTRNPFHELRLNPKNTGRCPGHCQFCHRPYSHRLKPNNPKIPCPQELIVDITRRYGEDVFTKVNRIKVITELFGIESQKLDFLEEIHRLLLSKGYDVTKGFECASSDVRSAAGLAKLLKLVNPKRYSFSVEVFSNRNVLMSKFKGLPLTDVIELLEQARKIGFEEIQINYIAGLESIEAFRDGINLLVKKRLIDSIGISVFTPFFLNQVSLRVPEGWKTEYYYQMKQILQEHNVPIYNSESYEMSSPFFQNGFQAMSFSEMSAR